jgi:hypothetical protein
VRTAVGEQAEALDEDRDGRVKHVAVDRAALAALAAFHDRTPSA